MATAAYELQQDESLRGKVSEAEWAARVELAAAFRIAVARGWNRSTANHMTARVPDQPQYFLMNAADFAWDEITASNLLKLDMDGNVVSDTHRKPRPAGRISTARCMFIRRPASWCRRGKRGCSSSIRAPAVSTVR